jgi:hypothetical protein
MLSFARITSKSESIRLLNAGRLGNHVRTWPSILAMRGSGYRGNVVIRSYKPSFATIYNLPQEHLDAMLASLAGNGHALDTLYCNETCPDDRLILQGEIIGHSLTYSSARLPMKKALQVECRHAEGSACEAILRWAMNGSSYEDFLSLREQRPDAVIEFGCYEICLGNVPDRNTLIWEVRDTF